MKSLTEALPFVVECKSTYPFFETIASFDCRPAADAYVSVCSAANPSYQYRVTVPVPVIEHASEIERRIVGRLVRDLLAAGLTITVWNGGDEAELIDCTDEDKIFAELAASDQDELTMDGPDGYAGWIRLVWGNDCDVISDYSTRLETIMAPANALADELDGGVEPLPPEPTVTEAEYVLACELSSNAFSSEEAATDFWQVVRRYRGHIFDRAASERGLDQIRQILAHTATEG